MREVNLVFKRFFDIVASLIAIFLLTIIPIFTIIPIVIRLTSKGPVLFRQKRIGKNCKPFTMYKYRTMIVERYDKSGNEIMSEDRITKVGKFLRKTSFDELPQLFNILNGSMSIVGPRPMLDYQAPRCEGEEVRRFEMRPGITGLAQAKGRNNISWEERIKYDVEYVKNFSILLDIKVIFETVLIVLKRDGTDVKSEYRGVDRFSIHYAPKSRNKNSEDIKEII